MKVAGEDKLYGAMWAGKSLKPEKEVPGTIWDCSEKE